MSDDAHLQFMAQQANRLEAERAAEFAQMEACRLRYDENGANGAADRILELDNKLNALGQRAQTYVQQNTPQPRDHRSSVDLTPNEVVKMCGIDPNTYNAGVSRLQALKRAGSYRE